MAETEAVASLRATHDDAVVADVDVAAHGGCVHHRALADEHVVSDVGREERHALAELLEGRPQHRAPAHDTVPETRQQTDYGHWPRRASRRGVPSSGINITADSGTDKPHREPHKCDVRLQIPTITLRRMILTLLRTDEFN